MALPTCECVKGLPIGEQLAAIYCATYTLAAGDVDGPYLLKSANLSDVADPVASRINIDAAGSSSGFATFTGPTSAHNYSLLDSDAAISSAYDKVKPIDTSRSSTDVLADDPVLIETLTPGTYIVTVLLNFFSSSTTPGAKVRLNMSGGSASAAPGTLWYGSSGTAGVNAVAPNLFDANIFAGIFGSSGTQDLGVRIFFSVIVTATTSLSVQWAQQVSDPTATLLKAGSSMHIHRPQV